MTRAAGLSEWLFTVILTLDVWHGDTASVAGHWAVAGQGGWPVATSSWPVVSPDMRPDPSLTWGSSLTWLTLIGAAWPRDLTIASLTCVLPARIDTMLGAAQIKIVDCDAVTLLSRLTERTQGTGVANYDIERRMEVRLQNVMIISSLLTSISICWEWKETFVLKPLNWRVVYHFVVGVKKFS